MSNIHARTSAAFIADAKARCDASASIPADAAAADQAIAAIEAGLIESGAVEARPHFTVIMRRGTMAIARRYQAATSADAGAMALADCAPATIIRIMPSPAMVPQQAQQQQANAAPSAPVEAAPGMKCGDYVIGPNPGHGRIISTAPVWALATDANGFTTGEARDIGTALVKWLDGTHGRYPRTELRVVEFRPQPAFFPHHEGH